MLWRWTQTKSDCLKSNYINCFKSITYSMWWYYISLLLPTDLEGRRTQKARNYWVACTTSSTLKRCGRSRCEIPADAADKCWPAAIWAPSLRLQWQASPSRRRSWLVVWGRSPTGLAAYKTHTQIATISSRWPFKHTVFDLKIIFSLDNKVIV